MPAQGQQNPVLHTAAAEVPRLLGSHSGPVIVQVSTEWCVPCRLMRPIMRKLAGEFADRMVVAYVDGDSAGSFLKVHDIESFPQLLLFKDGAFVRRHNGFESAAGIRKTVLDFIGAVDGDDPTADELAFRDACSNADAVLEAIMAPASAALAPSLEAIRPDTVAFEASLANELAAGHITRSDAGDRRHQAYARFYAPFRDKIEALKAAQARALDAYDACLNEAVEQFLQRRLVPETRSASSPFMCMPGDESCSIPAPRETKG
jgi:thioredoxin-like negative regulator of GroEL